MSNSTFYKTVNYHVEASETYTIRVRVTQAMKTGSIFRGSKTGLFTLYCMRFKFKKSVNILIFYIKLLLNGGDRHLNIYRHHQLD